MGQKYLNCELLYEDGTDNMTRVVQLDDGSLFTLVNLSRQVRDMGSYPKHQFVFSRRSFDGGKTWSMPFPLFEIPEIKAYVRALPFFISKEGFLHVFMMRIKVYDFAKEKFEGDILYARMDDISGENLIIRKIECLDRYTGALNNVIQLGTGRIVVPFSTLIQESKTFVSNTIYSDDQGITWNVSNDISVESEETHIESGAVEPVITEVSSNKLVMIIRTVLGSFFYAVSKDGGASWSKAKKSGIKSSNAPAVLQKMNDGRIFIAWNNCNGAPMHGVRYSLARQCLHAAVSDDGLKTLKGCRIIAKKDYMDPDGVLNCYPYSDITADNELLIKFITVKSKDKENWIEPNAKLIKLSVEFLENSGIIDDFSKGLDNWIACGQTKIVAIDGENALSVKSKDDSNGYAMINFPYGQKGKIGIKYKTSVDFNNAQLIISDNYVDRLNFLNKETNTQYNEYIEDSFITVELSCDTTMDKVFVGNGIDGSIEIEWDCTAKKMTVNGLEIAIPESFKGFNHFGINIPCDIEQEFILKKFVEESDKAWLDTGISI